MPEAAGASVDRVSRARPAHALVRRPGDYAATCQAGSGDCDCSARLVKKEDTNKSDGKNPEEWPAP